MIVSFVKLFSAFLITGTIIFGCILARNTQNNNTANTNVYIGLTQNGYLVALPYGENVKKEFYVLQVASVPQNFALKKILNAQIEFTESSLFIKNDQESCLFSINSTHNSVAYQNANQKYIGYGLAHVENPIDFYDEALTTFNTGGPTGPDYVHFCLCFAVGTTPGACTSGGTGSTSCSISGPSGSCSVSCSAGNDACCFIANPGYQLDEIVPKGKK